MTNNDTYCPLLFRELAVRPNGELTPCCRTNPIPGESAANINRAWTSEYMEDLRNQSLSNTPIPQCQRCYLEEKHGRKSLREYSIAQYGYPTDRVLKGIHLSLSNVCNIKCRHCGHHSSSKWHSDAVKMGMTNDKSALITSNFNLQSLDLNKIDRLQFYGGEPFLHHEELYEILSFKKSHGTLHTLDLALGTNGTTSMPEPLLELIAQAKKVWFSFSIDAVEDFAEYFRSGTDWKFLIENINLARQIFGSKTNVTIASNTTITIYNINVLKQIENYLTATWPWLQQNKTALALPKIQNARNLPNKFKEIVKSRHNSNSKWDRYTCNLLDEQPVESFDNFIKWHKKLDDVRNEKLEDYNPELASWIEEFLAA